MGVMLSLHEVKKAAEDKNAKKLQRRLHKTQRAARGQEKIAEFEDSNSH